MTAVRQPIDTGRSRYRSACHGRFEDCEATPVLPDGIELIDEIRRVAPEQAERLIFLSGGAFTAQTRDQLDELGAPQLEKPVTAKELRACVMRIATETWAAADLGSLGPLGPPLG